MNRVGLVAKPPSLDAPAAQHNQVLRDRPFPGAESPSRSRQDFDIDRWEPGNERPEKHPEPYRGIFYEPPYSIWEAAVGFTVIVIGRLLYLLLSGQ